MKTLHISSGFPLSYPGGIPNYVRSLAQSQIALGHEVHVLARPETDRSRIPAGVHLHEYYPAKVTAFSLKTTRSDFRTSDVWRLIERENYDLVHFHMSLDFPLEFFQTFPLLGVPYVVSLHDYFYICPRILMVDAEDRVCRSVQIQKCASCIGVLDQIDLVRRGARKLNLTLPRIRSSASETRLERMRDFLEHARMLLPVSERTAQIYRDVIPAGKFQTEHIGNESANCEVPKKVDSRALRLTFMGTLNLSKGALVLEQLLKRVRRQDIEFHFYGRAFDGFERLRREGLLLHGSYGAADLPMIIANTDIGLVLPVWEDNGPQVAMEFVNFKTPVIGTKRGGVPDIVSSDWGFLFDPDDEHELEAVVSWIERVTPEELAAISRRMTRLKTPKEHALCVHNLYESLLDCAPSGAEVAH